MKIFSGTEGEKIELDMAQQEPEGLQGDDDKDLHPDPKVSAQNRGSIQYTQTRIFDPLPSVLSKNRIVADSLGTPAAEVFRMLRTQVRLRMKRRCARTLGICSARETEGKSLIALNLAISMSLDVNQTVLLTELDLRRPSMCRTIGYAPEFGLDDYFLGAASIQECLVNIGFERLVLLPARQPMARASEYLASPCMMELSKELRDRYPDRMVIYDMPPILTTDESISIMNKLDACLFVVEEGNTGKKDVERAIELLDRDRLIGTVLNKASALHNKPYTYTYY